MTSRWWLKKKNATIFLLIQLQVGHATCQHISRTSVSVSSEIVSIAGLHMNGKCLLINNKYLHVQYLIRFLSKHQHKNLLSSGRSSSFNCSLNELDYPKCKLSTSDDSSSSHILIWLIAQFFFYLLLFVQQMTIIMCYRFVNINWRKQTTQCLTT